MIHRAPRVLAISPPVAGPWVEQLDQLVDDGVDGLVLRLVDGPADLLTVLARPLPAALSVFVRPVAPEDLQLAWQHGLGLHLPDGDDDIEGWRDTHGGPLSVSRHDVEGAARAVAGGADLVTLAPIFSPGSKPHDTRRPLGPEVFGALRGLPVLALGGITSVDRARACVEAGAHGIAGITGFFEQGARGWVVKPCEGLVTAVREPLS